MGRSERSRLCDLGLVAATISVVAGCQARDGVDRAGVTLTDSAGVPFVLNTIGESPATCAPEPGPLRITSGGTVEGATLFGIRDAALLDDGRIAVVNSGTYEVLVFNPDGTLTTRFGRSGDGPGEFKNLWSIDVRSPDTLVIGDNRPWRFNVFTSDGSFVRSATLDPPLMDRPDHPAALASGLGFILEQPEFPVASAFQDRTVPVWLFAEDGQRRSSVGVFWMDRFGLLSEELGFVGNPIFGARAVVLPSGGDRILYGTGRHERVEFWSLDGQLQRVIQWQSRPRRVLPNDIDAFRAERRATLEARVPAGPSRSAIIDSEVGPDRPVAADFPGHSRIVLSTEGDLWVEEYRRPLDQGDHRWWVFDSTGRFRCQVLLPNRFTPLTIGQDRVWGVATDDLDVESLVGIAISEPG